MTETGAPSETPKRRNRVLAVEDDPDVIESFRILLELIGNDVCAAPDGPSALEAAREFHPNIAFVDVDLPGMNGYEVAARLRRQYGRQIRLFALTGFGQPADRDRAIKAGFDLHLVKPIDLGFLQKLLNDDSIPT